VTPHLGQKEIGMGRIGRLLIPVVASALVLAACGSSSSSDTQSSGGDATVTTASNAKLGQTILVDAQGMTLYRLSGEQGGHWICKDKTCLSSWHPVTGAPTGADGLSAVKRPDGTKQVAFQGMPLYTFAGDTKAGETAGQGLKDVGTWSAVTTKGAPAQSQTNTASSGPYGY
jgi:predicted lipoprotein with Yx(FWY)xxD motif